MLQIWKDACRNLTFALMAVALIHGAPAFAKEELTEQPVSLAHEGGHTVDFPVIGWLSLPARLTNERVFRNIRDSGVNVFMTCADSTETIRAQLDLAAKHGLQALVRDPRFASTDGATWREDAKAAADEYRSHPGVFGFYVKDEPGPFDLGWVGEMVALLRSYAPEKVAYVNSFGGSRVGMDSFEQYVESYAETIRPAFLGFDYYPIAETDYKPKSAGPQWDAVRAADMGVEWPELKAYYRDTYWGAWETFRMAQWKYDLPLWGFVLASPHKHMIWQYGPVTEGTLRLEAFTGLAYAIQAIQYYGLVSSRLPPAYEDGILDQEGNPSPRYGYFQSVNRDLSVLGPLLKNYRTTGVFHTGPLTSGCRRFSAGRWEGDSTHRGLTKLEGDPAIVSFLKGPKGERCLLLVNRNPGRAGRIEAVLDKGLEAVELTKRDGTEIPISGRALKLDLAPGDGKLFRLRTMAAQ